MEQGSTIIGCLKTRGSIILHNLKTNEIYQKQRTYPGFLMFINETDIGLLEMMMCKHVLQAMVCVHQLFGF